MIHAVNQYMPYVNCIYIDSETNYCMILITYKSPKQHTCYKQISGMHSNNILCEQIHIKINETCWNIHHYKMAFMYPNLLKMQ